MADYSEPRRRHLAALRGRSPRTMYGAVRGQSTSHADGSVSTISQDTAGESTEREQRRLAEALRDTASALTSTLRLEEVLDRILTHVADFVPHEIADIFLIRHDMAALVRSRGRSDDQHAQWENFALPLATTRNLRQMIETGQPVLIDNTLLDAHWITIPHTEWVRAFLGAPIQLEGQTIGFINLTTAYAHRFTARHAASLQAFADQAAIAIRNARMYEALEARVVERTAELALERDRLRVILEATGEGIFYTEGTHIQYANSALCALTGYTLDELVDAPMSLLRGENQALEDAETPVTAFEPLHHGRVWRNEIRLRRKDGSEFDAGLTISLVGDVDENVRSVTVVRDISAAKALEAQQARFVAYASHELRTPITNLLTRIYLMKRLPDRYADHLVTLEEIGSRMRRLVEDLLDMSRFERGVIRLNRQLVTLQELAAGVVSAQSAEADTRSITLTTLFAPTPLHVHADPLRLTQVITNLVTNAIHYTPPGGEVTVIVAPDELTGSGGVIAVRDTGAGIAAEHLPYIFQPFYRVINDVQGTGLGLSIAREIVALHGGTIDVQSEPGRGSVFTVFLVLADESQRIAVEQ